LTSIASIIGEATGNWLRQSEGLPVAKVLEVNDYLSVSGGCESCYEEEVAIGIKYLDHQGKKNTYDYYGDFADFIRLLDRYTD
jgi:hypothetical protein